MSPPLTRRSLLAIVGTATTGVLGGCSMLSGTSNGGAHVGLTSVSITNRRDDPQTVIAHIESAGELVVNERAELEGTGGALIRCEWPNTTGPYVVQVEHEQSGESETLRLDDVTDPPADVELLAVVRRRDRPSISLYYPASPSADNGCSNGTDATNR